MDRFCRWVYLEVRHLFELLHIVRVYAKPPGKPIDRTDPFTLPIGSTVHDLAQLVHRQLADKLKTARLWGVGSSMMLRFVCCGPTGAMGGLLKNNQADLERLVYECHLREFCL